MTSKDKTVDIREYALKYLETHDTIQPADIVKEVGKTRQAVSRELNRMGEQGLLVAVPSEKGYVVWQLPTKERWRGIRNSDFEQEGAIQIICSLAEAPSTTGVLSQALSIDKSVVYCAISSLERLGLLESELLSGRYWFSLSEHGEKVAKILQQIERVN